MKKKLFIGACPWYCFHARCGDAERCDRLISIVSSSSSRQDGQELFYRTVVLRVENLNRRNYNEYETRFYCSRPVFLYVFYCFLLNSS